MNGRFLSGAKPFEEFATAIHAELGRLNLPVPAGAPAKSLGIGGWTWSGKPPTPAAP